MPSLLDIMPLSKKVRLGGGQEVEFFGLSAREIGALVKRFPEAQVLLGAGSSPASIVDIFPELAAAAIAASAHAEGVEEEEAAARWSGADQSLALAAIAEMSLPASIAGPFAAVFQGATPAPDSPAAPLTSSPEQSID